MSGARGRIIRAADLFCGAGGTSEGLLQACREMGLRLDLVAVNHWPRAIETHMANHPWAKHVCASLTGIDPPKDGQKTLFQCIDAVDPASAVAELPGRGKRLDLLVASPECTDHSNAKGGRPRNAQSRATPWCIPRWIEAASPKRILVENVPEFVNWGRLGARGKPLKSKRGGLFKAWLASLDAFGYRLEWRILNAADYGDATTRRRFFLQAVRGRGKITWPSPSHAPADKAEDLDLEPWKPAREIIDWAVPGKSIFKRKRPLSPNTLRRIATGIEKYWGAWAQPFLVMMYGTNNARSLDRPLPAVTAQGQHAALAEPFLVAMNYTKSAEHDKRYTKDVGRPVPTVTSQGNRLYLTEGFLVPQFGEREGQEPRTHEVGKPLPSPTSHGAVVEPFVMPISHGGKRRPRRTGEPLPTLTGSREQYVVEPLILPQHGGADARGVRHPAPTVATKGAIQVIEPFVLATGQTGGNGRRVRTIDQPVSTLVSKQEQCVVEPLVVRYDRTGKAKPVGEPVDTLSTRNRFGLAEPGLVRDGEGNVYALDIRFRMLQPHELAAAMSFPKGYRFQGNKSEQVRQIGNAVAVRTARALCRAVLAG